MYFLKSNFLMRKFSISIIIFSLLFVFLPKKADAQYVDIVQLSKEFGLDTIAVMVGKITLKKLTAKTVNWINSGFKGNPAYVADPKQFFLEIADSAASDVLSSTQLNKLCTPFKASVRLALVKNYLADQDNYSCTLRTLKNNYDQFTKDFSKGGWDGWFEVTQTSGNTPFGAYLNVQSGLNKKINSGTTEYKKELEQGQGFLSFKRCKEGKKLTAGEVSAFNYLNDTNLKAGDCLDTDKETTTPGSVINDQLSNSLGSAFKQLEAADEINEIVTALVTQLVEQVIGGVGKGLRGVSERPAGGGQSYTSQLGAEGQPPPTVDPNSIEVKQGGINCSSSSTSSGNGDTTDGSEPSPNDGNGSSGNSNFSSNCTSEPTTVSGLPKIDFGSGTGGGGGGSCPVPTTPKSLCEKVDQGAVLAILNKYRPSNAGITAAIVEVNGLYPEAKVLAHARLDKIDFGGGLVVDVIIGALGGTREGKGWGWGVDCECGNTGTAPGTGNTVSAVSLIQGGGGEDESGAPTSLLEDVRSERAKYGTNVVGGDLGALLNAIAWKNRSSGWGLSRKDFGEQCASPVGQIACDILYHRPSNTIYDVLYAAGEVSKPQWDKLGENTDERRPWVAPVQP